jgi:putative hydrolase of the HAD superfamily
MPNKQYILFDIDDTLFPSTEFSALARKNALNAMINIGLEADYDDLSLRLTKIINERGSNYEKHFDDLCSQLGVKEPARYISAAIAAYHDTKTAIAPFPKVPLTLLKLKERGYKLYIATQGSSVKQWDKLIRLRIALFFDGVFVSDEIGENKGKKFYLNILKKLNTTSENCIMVGDREDCDITPTKEIGIRTVRILSGKYSIFPNQNSGGMPASGISNADFIISDISELSSILK